jgi:hypothetical protein
MNRRACAATLTILAAFFAGCTSRGPENPATVSVTPVEQPYRAGTGVVQAATPAPGLIAAGPQTSARSPAAPSDSGLQRLRIRMDDGRMVYVDTPGKDFAPGQRVLLSDANEIRRQ